jgi:CDP-diacylglycerol--glycerol-3-phosphate 3-phosphatidyltransferase
MPLLHDLQQSYRQLLRPLAALLARSGITATMVTILVMLGSLAYGIWIYQPFADHGPNPYPYLLLAPFLLLRMALNVISELLTDTEQATPAGMYSREIGLVVSDAALYLPFLDLLEFSIGWVIMVGLCGLAEFAGLLGATVGASRRHDGPFGAGHRAFFFSILGLFTSWAVFAHQPVLHGIIMNWALLLAALLALLTIFRRVRGGIREAAHHK